MKRQLKYPLFQHISQFKRHSMMSLYLVITVLGVCHSRALGEEGTLQVQIDTEEGVQSPRHPDDEERRADKRGLTLLRQELTPPRFLLKHAEKIKLTKEQIDTLKSMMKSQGESARVMRKARKQKNRVLLQKVERLAKGEATDGLHEEVWQAAYDVGEAALKLRIARLKLALSARRLLTDEQTVIAVQLRRKGLSSRRGKEGSSSTRSGKQERRERRRRRLERRIKRLEKKAAEGE